MARHTASFRLPPLDREKIEQEERAFVARLVKMPARKRPKNVTDPATLGLVDARYRLAATAEAIFRADEELATCRPKRDRLALSLSFYDNGRALDRTIGISRGAFFDKRQEALHLTDEERTAQWLLGDPDESAEAKRARIAARAEAVGVERVPADEAKRDLPGLAERTYRAQARINAALVERDRAIVELMREHGMEREQAAQLAGIDPSQVSRVMGKADSEKRAAAA